MSTSACDPPPEDREPSGGITADPAGRFNTETGLTGCEPPAQAPAHAGDDPTKQSQAGGPGYPNEPTKLIDMDWSWMWEEEAPMLCTICLAQVDHAGTCEAGHTETHRAVGGHP